MKGWVQTNLIDVAMDVGRLDEMYEITVIRDEGKGSRGRLGEAADRLTEAGGVVSVRFSMFEESPVLYVLTDRVANARQRIRQNVDGVGDSFTYRKEACRSLWESESRIMVQLLLNSLSSRDLFASRFNNLSGRCLCIHSRWIKKEGFKALEFKVEPFVADESRMILSMSVTSFDKVSSFSGDVPKGMARYRLNGLTPVRASMNDKEGFINKRASRHKKNSVDYLNLKKENYDSCKAGIFNGLIDMYNGVFRGVSSMTPVRFAERERIHTPTPSRFQDPFDALIAERARAADIRIVDLESDEESRKACEKILDSVCEMTGRRPVTADAPVEGAFNICVIHDRDSYGEDRASDPYRIYHGAGVQHITVENVENIESEDVRNVLFKELIIKDDLGRGRFSIFDWASLGLEGGVSFMMCRMRTEKRKSFPVMFYRLTVHPDGRFEHESMDPAMTMDEDTLLWDSGPRGSNPEYVVRDWSGSRCVVRKTALLPIPDDEGVRQCLGGEGAEGPRGKIIKDNFINSALDLSISEFEGSTYYVSGYNRNNLRYELRTAPNIRWIESSPGSEGLESLILELMKVPFVRYNQLTVSPFPVKYLREVMRMDDPLYPEGDEEA